MKCLETTCAFTSLSNRNDNGISPLDFSNSDNFVHVAPQRSVRPTPPNLIRSSPNVDTAQPGGSRALQFAVADIDSTTWIKCVCAQ